MCPFFCDGDEENGHCACTNGHLTTANQSEIRKAYLVSVMVTKQAHSRSGCRMANQMAQNSISGGIYGIY